MKEYPEKIAELQMHRSPKGLRTQRKPMAYNPLARALNPFPPHERACRLRFMASERTRDPLPHECIVRLVR